MPRRFLLLCGLAMANSGWAADPVKLTLRDAERLAMAQHPLYQSAQYVEQAAAQVVDQVRARRYPFSSANITGAGGATDNSRILAGGINNPVVFDRVAAGVNVSQMISDFGRTRNLTENARLRERAQREVTAGTRAQILLSVDRLYYGALRARAVLQVAEQTVAARQLVADQTESLANSKLKSMLDVTFAKVSLDEAKLLLSNAQNEARAAVAELTTAMGQGGAVDYELVEEPLPVALPGDGAAFVAEARDKRPELRQARLEREAAERFTQAEKSLMYPTISAVASAGYSPVHVAQLRRQWLVAGFNVELPFLNGGLYTARRKEAEARQKAVGQVARDVENRIERDVRLAYLGALNAFQRLQLTGQLLEQAALSLQLAQSRYQLGLSGMIELNQAQLNVTRAQIAQASAKFEYQSARALLEFQVGTL